MLAEFRPTPAAFDSPKLGPTWAKVAPNTEDEHRYESPRTAPACRSKDILLFAFRTSFIAVRPLHLEHHVRPRSGHAWVGRVSREGSGAIRMRCIVSLPRQGACGVGAFASRQAAALLWGVDSGREEGPRAEAPSRRWSSTPRRLVPLCRGLGVVWKHVPVRICSWRRSCPAGSQLPAALLGRSAGVSLGSGPKSLQGDRSLAPC